MYRIMSVIAEPQSMTYVMDMMNVAIQMEANETSHLHISLYDVYFLIEKPG